MHPGRPELGTRTVPFSKVLYIEQDDFMEEPPVPFRLGPGRRWLRCAYFITCQEVVKDPASGEAAELRCSYDPHAAAVAEPLPTAAKASRVPAPVLRQHAVDAEIRLYDRLFVTENPSADKEGDFKDHLNPESLQVLSSRWSWTGRRGAGEPVSIRAPGLLLRRCRRQPRRRAGAPDGGLCGIRGRRLRK
ncbi:MAG: hypothetical protein R2864_07770 [Syntrophotaleaceae bacterium]